VRLPDDMKSEDRTIIINESDWYIEDGALRITYACPACGVNVYVNNSWPTFGKCDCRAYDLYIRVELQ